MRVLSSNAPNHLLCTARETRRTCRARSARGRRAGENPRRRARSASANGSCVNMPIEDHEIVARRVVHRAEHERSGRRRTRRPRGPAAAAAPSGSPATGTISRIDLQRVGARFEPGLPLVVPETTANVVFSSTFAAGEPRHTGRMRRVSRERVAQRRRGIGAQDRAVAAREDRNRERDLLLCRASVTLVGAHSRSMLPCCTSRSAVVDRDRHPVHRQRRQRELRLHLRRRSAGTARRA